MPFSGSNFSLNNFDYMRLNNNLNGSFGNSMFGTSNYNNFFQPQVINNRFDYYDKMLGMTMPDLSQSLSNISANLYSPMGGFPAFTSPNIFQQIPSSFLDIQSQEEITEKNFYSDFKNQGSKRLVNIAASQLGKNEKDGSYHKFTKGHNVPWCAAFVTWCLRKNGTAAKGDNGKWNENWSCDALAKNLLEENPDALAFDRKKGLTDTSKIKPGAVIFFSDDHTSKDYTHTGIVDYVDDDGNIHTIEGNQGDKVSKRSYKSDNKYVQTVVNVC